MDIIYHILGLCPDSTSHLDLLDFLRVSVPVCDIFHFLQLNVKISLTKLFSMLNA